MALLKLEQQKELRLFKNATRYTLGGYSIKSLNNKIKISNNKLKSVKFRLYIKLISLFPQIKLVGLSGSISMLNAKKDDDIDLFIITAKNRLFTGRFISLLLAQILGLRRKRDSGKNEKNTIPSSLIKDKICLNLFFDERELLIPKIKQTEFVAHEVLQMKPIVSKYEIYERFLATNKWVFKIFPNAVSVFSMKYKVSSMWKKIPNTKYFILDTFFDKIELILKNIELRSINQHRTTELITNTQLWFHPDDFEKKIVKNLKM